MSRLFFTKISFHLRERKRESKRKEEEEGRIIKSRLLMLAKSECTCSSLFSSLSLFLALLFQSKEHRNKITTAVTLVDSNNIERCIKREKREKSAGGEGEGETEKMKMKMKKNAKNTRRSNQRTLTLRRKTNKSGN